MDEATWFSLNLGPESFVILHVWHIIGTILTLLTVWKAEVSLGNGKFKDLMGCLKFYIQYNLNMYY